MLISNIIFFFVAITILILSGSFLVKYLLKIAKFIRVSEFVLAFILMAFATTIPELSVGVISAINKVPNLSLGNVIGSNIVNLTLIMGIAILLSRGIKVKPSTIKMDSILMLMIIIIPLILYLIGGKLSRLDGLILIGVFFTHTHRLLKRGKVYKKKVEDGVKRSEIVFNIFLFILSLSFLILSANFVVKYAEKLSIDFGLPEIMIGLFLIAFGTSLPELVFITTSAIKGHGEFAFGDLFGSVISNSTLVLGVTALIFPITANFLLFLTSAIFMVIITILFITFLYSNNKLGLLEGISLILLYGFFIMIEFYIKTLS